MSDPNNNYDDQPKNHPPHWEGGPWKKPPFPTGGIFAGFSGSHSHVVLGIIALVLGIMFLLGNLGIFYIGHLWQFWPVILIGIGISQLLDARNVQRMISSAVLVAVGVIFLAHNLGYIPWYLWNWHLLWPVLLIYIGVMILLSGFGRHIPWPALGPFARGDSSDSFDVLKEMVVFGGINRIIVSQDFQVGQAMAIFGGVEINLRRAATTKSEIEIEASAVFGGVELTVPDTWDVTVRGAGILGGYEDKTYPVHVPEDGKRTRLIVRGAAIFGGVTVKN
jgi:predicted membrane protein